MNLTDQQLEKAAREYCRLIGCDPDEMVSHGADPDPSGFTTMQNCYSPRWTRVKRDVLAHHHLTEALRLATEPENDRDEAREVAAKLRLFKGWLDGKNPWNQEINVLGRTIDRAVELLEGKL